MEIPGQFSVKINRLVEAGANLIIMDDGFQSARLTLDYALVVIDSIRGIGNGFMVPAGPVRAPIKEQMNQLSAILKVGGGSAADPLVRKAARAGRTIFVSAIQPVIPPWPKEQRLKVISPPAGTAANKVNAGERLHLSAEFDVEEFGPLRGNAEARRSAAGFLAQFSLTF